MTESPIPPLQMIQLSLEEYQMLIRRLTDLDEDVNRVDRDLTNDRKDMEQLKLKQDAIINRLDSIMEILTRFQVKTKDAVKDAVAEETQPLRKQIDKFVEKKIVRIRTEGFTTRVLNWFKGVKSIWI